MQYTQINVLNANIFLFKSYYYYFWRQLRKQLIKNNDYSPAKSLHLFFSKQENLPIK